MAQLAQVLGNKMTPLANPHRQFHCTKVESQLILGQALARKEKPVSPLKSTQLDDRLLFLHIRKTGLFHNRVICPSTDVRSLWEDLRPQPERHNRNSLFCAQ